MPDAPDAAVFVYPAHYLWLALAAAGVLLGYAIWRGLREGWRWVLLVPAALCVLALYLAAGYRTERIELTQGRIDWTPGWPRSPMTIDTARVTCVGTRLESSGKSTQLTWTFRGTDGSSLRLASTLWGLNAPALQAFLQRHGVRGC